MNETGRENSGETRIQIGWEFFTLSEIRAAASNLRLGENCTQEEYNLMNERMYELEEVYG